MAAHRYSPSARHTGEHSTPARHTVRYSPLARHAGVRFTPSGPPGRHRAPETPQAPEPPQNPKSAHGTPYPRNAVDRQRPGGNSIGLLAAALLVIGLFAASAGLGQLTDVRLPSLASLFDRPGEAPPRAFPVLEPSRPTRVTIPAIRVEAPVRQVGLAADGSIDVPPASEHDVTGWYEDGPTPGEFGSAVIVGHVDNYTGPSVFYRLHDLRRGDTIEIAREDRETAVFEVSSVELFDRTGLPADRVYADFTRPHLRLITCGGRWAGGDVGYRDNVVVFATLSGAKS
ncbi:class F sortase [Catenuloplanes japonicus]|uniref:class F sortase n=1 Tax=Catenuloplanes japonicus TaxID=33876 RepID=UPI0006901572|nr:class F sortase [Catenuloplanes japonicus]